MQVQLLVERDQNECIVKLAGTAYKFERNEHGHLVSDITDQEHIKWISDPHHNTAFKVYSPPEKTVIENVSQRPVVVMAAVADELGAVAGEPDPLPEAEPALNQDRPPFPQKGSKRPPKRSES